MCHHSVEGTTSRGSDRGVVHFRSPTEPSAANAEWRGGSTRALAEGIISDRTRTGNRAAVSAGVRSADKRRRRPFGTGPPQSDSSLQPMMARWQ